ncbi:hypothetical protein V8G54_005761 [Vigna mungo]|uniref:Uncharacterized protein n=1 Tax=Vigna mungo TaxID=3915 RepID=A0AAQ3S7D9_VIGMU
MPTVVSPACSPPSTSSPTARKTSSSTTLCPSSPSVVFCCPCASTVTRAVLVDIVSRVEEDEEDLDPRVGRECVEEPEKMGSVESRVLRMVNEEFGTKKEFIGLGEHEKEPHQTKTNSKEVYCD